MWQASQIGEEQSCHVISLSTRQSSTSYKRLRPVIDDIQAHITNVAWPKAATTSPYCGMCNTKSSISVRSYGRRRLRLVKRRRRKWIDNVVDSAAHYLIHDTNTVHEPLLLDACRLHASVRDTFATAPSLVTLRQIDDGDPHECDQYVTCVDDDSMQLKKLDTLPSRKVTFNYIPPLFGRIKTSTSSNDANDGCNDGTRSSYDFGSYRKCVARLFGTVLRKMLGHSNLHTEQIQYTNTEDSKTRNGSQNVNNVAEASGIILESPEKRMAKKTVRLSVQSEPKSVMGGTIAERRLAKKASQSAKKIETGPKVSNGESLQRPQPPSKSKVQVVDVPRFFFPKGTPVSMNENEAALRRVSELFGRLGNKVEMIDMIDICKAAGIPVYWKRAVFESCRHSGKPLAPITLIDFANWWNRMTSTAHDEAARFIYTVAGPNRNYLTKEDFAPLLQDLIETFPGLHFLREAQEFHARYVETVTMRIFWSVNRSWSGRVTANELRRSNFLETVRRLETTDDINLITDYFSYEHFYVIYCKFYELDKDHDLVINKIDMSQHANGALPPQIIDRIFSSAVTRSPSGKRIRGVLETIDYPNFVAFLLAEEDKTHPTSIEYWFRCLDLDGDGLLSMFEMEHFYNGVRSKMDQHNIDSMKFEDVLCNLLDLIRPRQPNAIALSDLKKCSLCTRFFNTFVNWVKYYEQESSEGERATVTDGEEELNDWDRYCLEEYEALMADDQDNDEPEDINLSLDDDDDILNGTNVSTTVNLSLRDFSDLRRGKILEAI